MIWKRDSIENFFLKAHMLEKIIGEKTLFEIKFQSHLKPILTN